MLNFKEGQWAIPRDMRTDKRSKEERKERAIGFLSSRKGQSVIEMTIECGLRCIPDGMV